MRDTDVVRRLPQDVHGRRTDDAPLVVFLTPGSYTGDFWISSGRRFVYVLGDPTNWPTLSGDSIAISSYELAAGPQLQAQVDAHRQRREPKGLAVHADAVEHRSVLRDPEQLQRHHEPERVDAVPVDYPHVERHELRDGLALEYVSCNVSRGSPLAKLEVNNIRILGTRASSGLKTTMQDVAIRHSLFSVSDDPGDPSIGLLMHTPIDVPAPSRLVVYGNKFLLYRASTVTNPTAGRESSPAPSICDSGGRACWVATSRHTRMCPGTRR